MLTLQRRKEEIADLIKKKGGVCLSVLRPSEHFQSQGLYVSNYALLELASESLGYLLRNYIKAGAGTVYKRAPSTNAAAAAYLQVLQQHIRFSAFCASEQRIAELKGVVLAANSVGDPIAFQFPIREGLIAFVPDNFSESERRGAAIVATVRKHFDRQTPVDAPLWAGGITVPGAANYDAKISALRAEGEALCARLAALESKQEELKAHVRLLFGYGKSVLEPAVRQAFRVIGFEVPEPDEYEGEWDMEVRNSQNEVIALGEIEGSEGAIDVVKYRQLLDYIEAEAGHGREYKGLLIANGFRTHPPDDPARQQQFSQHALKGVLRQSFCALPTTELFAAVTAVLAALGDQNLKNKIGASLLSTNGVWKFEKL